MVAVAVGLGSVDMPVPSVAEWEWLNWKFPRTVHAGDTIYARWTLTQKRPPVAGSPTSIVVWRVDVHTSDGAMCAEGEIGAKVRRGAAPARPRTTEAPSPVAVSTGAPRRRRRRSRSNGTAPEAPTVAAPVAPEASPERASGGSRRRRRRRSSSSAAREGEHESTAAQMAEPERPQAPASPTTPAQGGKGLGGVLRRLRRT